MIITPDTILHLIELEIRKDKKNYIVEDRSAQEFYEMPVVCIDAIEMINKGMQLGEIEEELIRKYPNEEVDIVDFANQLIELNLVKSVNGEEINRIIETNNKAGFEWIPQWVGKVFFNTFTIKMYIAIFFINIIIFVLNPSLFPRYSDLFVFDVLTYNILAFALFSFINICIHELGHVLAMRSFNLPTKLGIGNRLVFVVLETDLSLSWKLSSKQRNVLFLAGICFDFFILFLILITKLVFPISSHIVSGFLGMIVFDIVLRFIYQCCIYMKTDFYYLFENVTGCYNLMENSIHMIKQKFSKSTVYKEASQFDGEKKFIKWYSVFYFVGVLLTLSLFIFYFLPQTTIVFIHAIENLKSPVSDLLFWDAVLFILQVIIFISLLIYSINKSRSKNI